MATDMTGLGERLAGVRNRIDRVGGEGVRLVVVTKSHPVEAVVAAARAGAVDVGENKAQELLGKLDELSTPDGEAGDPVVDQLRWHFIGQLQTNKVRKLAGRVWLWQSLDRPSVISEVAKRDPGAQVLIQVNISDDPNKGGCALSEVGQHVDLAQSSGLEVRGLMAVGPNGPPEDARPGFSAVRAEVDRLGLVECSIGMSNDLEVAVGEGATIVRVGGAIMGPRP